MRILINGMKMPRAVFMMLYNKLTAEAQAKIGKEAEEGDA